MGPGSDRIHMKNGCKGTVIQEIEPEQQTEGSGPGIDENPGCAEKTVHLFMHSFESRPHIVRDGQKNDAGSQNDTALKTSARAVMAMGNYVKGKELNERNQ
jgi:hypothetical protein